MRYQEVAQKDVGELGVTHFDRADKAKVSDVRIGAEIAERIAAAVVAGLAIGRKLERKVRRTALRSWRTGNSKHEQTDVPVDLSVLLREQVGKVRFAFEFGVVHDLTNSFGAAAHIAPADVQPALAQHAHPTGPLDATKSAPERNTFKGFEKSATKRSPDQDGAEPS